MGLARLREIRLQSCRVMKRWVSVARTPLPGAIFSATPMSARSIAHRISGDRPK